jgi:hypothetical protein
VFRWWRTIAGTTQVSLLRGSLPPEIPDDVDDPTVTKARKVRDAAAADQPEPHRPDV